MKEKKRWKASLRLYNIDGIPDSVVGVYGFWYRANGRCIYIGQSEKQSIKMRIRKHWRNSHNKQLKLWINCFGRHLDICYLPVRLDKTNKRDRIGDMETKLIQMWNPETNIKKKRS